MKSILNNILFNRVKTIVFTLFLLAAHIAQCQIVPEIFSVKRSGAQVKARLSQSGSYTNKIDTVLDDKYSVMNTGSWRLSYKHKTVYDRISISIKDTTKGMQKFDYLFNMTIDTFDSKQRQGSFNVIMRFSYDPASHKAYIDKSVYQFKHCHKYIVKINSILDSSLVNPASFSISTMQTNFVIESEIIVERYYLGSYATPISATSRSFIGKDKMRISWTPLASSSPNQYELEWTYIDTSGIKPDSLKYDFSRNSSRVLISKTYYDINTVYDAGVILYRVRRVKPDSVYYLYNKYSKWFPSSEPSKGYVKNYDTGKVYVSSHEAMGKNWDYQVAFAEEGLKKEVVNYFDGSLKRRQGVTLSNTNNFALVDESVYDHHGREVIKIIPAPSDSNTIRYYKKFNQNAAGKAYSAHDFDTSTTMADKCNGNYKAKQIGTNSGAGRYYSSSNPDKTNENAAIPDAQGYPLVQTQLTPDPTGRVLSQGGIGLVHQLGSGHETQYKYGTANQPELDRLFGSETGIANHYKKNAVIDPNGQMSISYIDQHGRVVATALTGGVPGMVDTVENFKLAKYEMINMSTNTKLVRNALVTNYSFNVTSAGTHKIFYKLETPDFTFGCLNKKQCYTCRYDIEFTLNDACGNTLLSFKRPIGRLSDTSCAKLVFNLKDSISKITGTVTANNDSVSFYLATGEYYLSKVLTVNTDSIERKIAEVISKDSMCYKTINTFIDAEMNQIDFSDCACDTCGTDTMSFCESRRQLMLEDLRPDGQYFLYDEETYLVSDPTSILRTVSSNPLYSTISATNFKDYSGRTDTVWINSQGYLPNQLTVKQFVENYKESWAEALLPLHPEYCYYRYCVDTFQASYVYDEVMAEIDNYDTALFYGYLNPMGDRTDVTELYNDPLFVNTNGTNKIYFSTFNYKLYNLGSYSIGSAVDPLVTGAASVNIWQLAMATGFCENISDNLQRQSCFKFYYENATVKNNWMNDAEGRDNYWQNFRGLYFQLKHKFIEERMNHVSMSGTLCVKDIGTTGDYKDKISHFVRYQPKNPLETIADSIEKEKTRLLDSLNYSSTCESSVASWDRALSLCANYSAHRDSILYHLLQVCKKGSTNSKFPNIMGATDVPAAFATGMRFKNFEAVLKYFIGSNYKTELCNIDLISSPRPYSADYEGDKPSEANDCICGRVKQEIQEFKGCYSKKDTLELGTEGMLVNDFVNLLVKSSRFNDTSLLSMNSGEYINIANKLFAPFIGGSSTTIKLKLKPSSIWANERTFVVYNGNMSNGCSFSFRLNPNTATFSNINAGKSAIIKPISQGVFSYTIYKTDNTTVQAIVYNTCFNNIGKCSPSLAPSELPAFTSYFNNKHLASLSEKQMEQLVGQCGNGGFPNEITDNTNTYYMRYGACPDYYRNYKEPKDAYMISFLNEMMRSNNYWRTGMTGFVSGDEAKRYLTTSEPQFHCNTMKADFLTQTKDYHFYKDFISTGGDNYWWTVPHLYVDSSLSISGVGKVRDTIWDNNYSKDPYYVGGFWIGARCDNKKDSTCFTSFGDPLKQLGTSGRPSLSQIDSLNHYRWSESLGAHIITCYNRVHPQDSVVLTMRNQCKTECNPLYRYKEVPVVYKDVFLKPGSGGIARLSNVTADIGINTGLSNPFMDMIKGLAGNGKLTNTAETDIRQYHKSFYLDDYYDALIPTTGGYLYKNEINDDSTMTGQLGKSSSPAQYCKFGLRKTGSNRSWSYSSINVFKDFAPDAEAISDGIRNDQLEMAGYHFTLKAGHVNSPGDTTWYPVKGWSSCWKFTEISAISGNNKALFYLPESFAGNCNCYTCPETRRWSDSLYAEYPKLHPAHANYETIVANYMNRKLNTNISFSEIQSQWDACGVANNTFIQTPRCSYRLSVKNTDCVGHADTMLLRVMSQTGLIFGYSSTKYSDSAEFCLDFTGSTAPEIAMLQDSLNKYFSSPYCSAFKKRINYREDYDLTLYNLDSANMSSSTCMQSAFDTWFGNVKTNLFSSSANLTKTTVSGVVYSEDNFLNKNTATWMAKIKFRNLDAVKRRLFEDTLRKWTNGCGGFGISRQYYRPELVPSTGADGICLINGTDTSCYNCDTLRRYMQDYQNDPTATAAIMKPELVESFLRGKTGKALGVYEGEGNCAGCANKSLYVCEQPSGKLLTFIQLLNKVAKNKKLNSANYVLNSGYTSMLNALKPTGAVLDSAAYQYRANTLGGWSITIKYNTTQSDVIFISSDTNDFFKKFNTGIDTFIQPRPIVAHGMISGFSLNARDSLYRQFVFNLEFPGLKAYQCCDLPPNVLCPQPYTRAYEQYEAPCKEEEVLQAIRNGTLLYYKYLDSIKRNLAMAYEAHCLKNAGETYKLGIFQQRYHSTLYYYDQAGNLIKTVPPKGVVELNLTPRQDSITRYRYNISDSLVNTWHTLGTNYRYNSLNQLVWQKTPDGGVSQFWYDRLGRLVLSQNAVQLARSGSTQKIYSYTRYDALGRICEVGEISNRAVHGDSLLNVLSYYNFWLNGSKARSQITKTFYDYLVMTKAGQQFAEGQRNLRGRVSSVAYYDAYVADSTAYTRSSHYSYDIHGNVDHLLHDFPDMAMVNSRYKHITYKYDLISGKVHSVAYQSGQNDQWFHRYSYDADNRLTLAETSTDSVIWDRDAEYKYYKHGPLARTLLGEHAVQGVDYAYTIHGWLKGVNSNTVQATRDIGKDGTGGLRKYTARDAYGFTLGYYNDLSSTGSVFEGDYKSIGTTSFEANTAGSPLAVSSANMYNGNITHMVSGVGVLFSSNSSSPLATIYKYDQLNRLKSVNTYTGINTSTNAWNSGSQQTAWSEKFTYDANGNITKLTRYNKTTTIDNLTYNYKSRTNQLTYVDDVISSGTVTTDIDDESSGNYRYDKIGNLTYDRAEKIDSIYWNVYGKISEIKRATGSGKSDLSFKYDAMGQRVLKITKPSLLETTWDYTWYVRDAQGNVMATYNKTNKLNVTDTGLYRTINNSLISRMNGDSLAAFIKYYFSGTQFNTDLATVIANKNLSDNLANVYAADSLLTYDNEFAQDVLQNYCTYYTNGTDRNNMFDFIWTNMKDSIVAMVRTGCLGATDAVTKLLPNDNTSNFFLNALSSYDPARFNALYSMMGGPPVPPPTTASKITFIRSQPDGVVANNVTMLFNQTELYNIIKTLSSTILYNTFVSGYDFCGSMIGQIANCAYSTAWFNFVKNTMDDAVVKNVISQGTESFYLASKLIEKDRKVLNKVVALSPALISDVLRGTSGLDLSTYLNYIYKRFGRTMFNNVLTDVGTIKIQKTLTLSELHIYGSSRHGINKPRRLLTRKSYVLTQIESDGQYTYGAARDSTFAKLNYKFFKRTLTLKQYELTNHLGNVLATILDRKTAVNDAAHGDTLFYYDADVSTAGMYYAFGSFMPDLAYTHDTGKYRYGFNGKEKEDETFEGCIAFEERIFDTRLARFFSTDPKEREYSWQTPFAYYKNCPIAILDIKGMGGVYDPVAAGETDADQSISGETGKATFKVYFYWNKDDLSISDEQLQKFKDQYTKKFNKSGMGDVFNIEFVVTGKKEDDGTHDQDEFWSSIQFKYVGKGELISVGDGKSYDGTQVKGYTNWMASSVINLYHFGKRGKDNVFTFTKMRYAGRTALHETFHGLEYLIKRHFKWQGQSLGNDAEGHSKDKDPNILSENSSESDFPTQDNGLVSKERLLTYQALLLHMYVYSAHTNKAAYNKMTEEEKKKIYDGWLKIIKEYIAKGGYYTAGGPIPKF